MIKDLDFPGQLCAFQNKITSRRDQEPYVKCDLKKDGFCYFQICPIYAIIEILQKKKES
jgi:hypothetical protein